MKNIVAVIFISLVLIQGISAQTEKQTISKTDKIVLDIKSNLNNYHKILSETDSLMDATNTNHNLTETAYKNGKELLLVQYVDLYGPMKSAEYYFNNNQLIYIEIKNRDNSFEKTYFNDNKLIAWYKNDKEIDNTSEDFKQVEKSVIPGVEKLIKLYGNR